jgi:hypothetical protein
VVPPADGAHPAMLRWIGNAQASINPGHRNAVDLGLAIIRIATAP